MWTDKPLSCVRVDACCRDSMQASWCKRKRNGLIKLRCCKTSAQDVTTHKFKPAEFTATYSGNEIMTTFSQKRACPTTKAVAVTCYRFTSPQFVPWLSERLALPSNICTLAEALSLMASIKMAGKNLDNTIFTLGPISLSDIILENSSADLSRTTGFVPFAYRPRR